MTHNIIKTENYLLVVDDSEIKEGDYRANIQRKTVHFVDEEPSYFNRRNDVFKKIIAHLPLNNSPILAGIALLPPLEDEVDKLSADYTEEWCSKRKVDVYIHDAFKAGYNKAKEKYKYTEEDLIKVWKACLDFNKPAGSDSGINFEEIIQSLQKPKMPVAFNCEMKQKSVNGSIPVNQEWEYEPKTTINSQGITQWIGKYIYE
jgi:hypothetical protein